MQERDGSAIVGILLVSECAKGGRTGSEETDQPAIGDRPAGYSGGSGTRNPEEVEQRFRRKWNSESGKWNTESGGSGTSIPEEVEQRFRRS